MFIGEASKLSGATQRAIRLYESVGLLKVSREGKYRVYTAENIALIKIIKEAQTLGISLSEMVVLISKQEGFDWYLVRDFLNQKYNMIENEIKNLEIKKNSITDFQVSIDTCLKHLDSNP
ncbi:MerR family transcriptional regulator [Vibrio rumoiensis]|uniref:MerR family transcriptional regulator n=1 Tax=Vibrio rumoiensis 1S-45 TaxID=1188252 RepID=A0A1E5E5R2_9VIBR|nr:MerR family transcriptional regulator [Vibrio rumoiensis]OEF29360.1 MerR family transcriptional regulator [Vibrio rumoiensis 1S-45]